MTLRREITTVRAAVMAVSLSLGAIAQTAVVGAQDQAAADTIVLVPARGAGATHTGRCTAMRAGSERPADAIVARFASNIAAAALTTLAAAARPAETYTFMLRFGARQDQSVKPESLRTSSAGLALDHVSPPHDR